MWTRVKDGFGGTEFKTKTPNLTATVSKTGSRLETEKWGWRVYDRTGKVIGKGAASLSDMAMEDAAKFLKSQGEQPQTHVLFRRR